MRFKITVRGEGTELRGYIDGDEHRLVDLSNAMKPFGLVVASFAPDDYNPFRAEAEAAIQELREKGVPGV